MHLFVFAQGNLLMPNQISFSFLRSLRPFAAIFCIFAALTFGCFQANYPARFAGVLVRFAHPPANYRF